MLPKMTIVALLLVSALPVDLRSDDGVMVRGKIVDADTGRLLPGRLYIQSADGAWHVARSASDRGSAVEYRKQRSPASVEVHTTLSADPFVAVLPPGKYTFSAERGKEYLTAREAVVVGDQPIDVTIRLKRWIDMSERGWYSGETHVHRTLEELPNAMLADDLNVALPLTYWVTSAHTPPSQGDKNSPTVEAKLIEVDATHVIYPLNTEYEIFTVGGNRHTLGAIFALNHKQVLTRGVPPVGPVAAQVHREGGLLELDKHNWPWSMMLVPVMNVDLYELTNNHLWRTEFFFRGFGEPPAEYMSIERDERGMTETGWIDFTFQNYYALLNCGFRLRPTAGTASGVHPVPLGFGRVYVHLPEGFSYDGWMKGLDAGHSFVTTGPLVMVHLDGRPPGTSFAQEAGTQVTRRLEGWIASANPLTRIEVVAAGEVIAELPPGNEPASSGGYRSAIELPISTDKSTWIAIRCFETAAPGRLRFAHSAPYHIDVAGRPLLPPRSQAEYLVKRVEAEIERNRGVLSDEELAEFRSALDTFRKRLGSAR